LANIPIVFIISYRIKLVKNVNISKKIIPYPKKVGLFFKKLPFSGVFFWGFNYYNLLRFKDYNLIIKRWDFVILRMTGSMTA